MSIALCIGTLLEGVKRNKNKRTAIGGVPVYPQIRALKGGGEKEKIACRSMRRAAATFAAAAAAKTAAETRII